MKVDLLIGGSYLIQNPPHIMIEEFNFSGAILKNHDFSLQRLSNFVFAHADLSGSLFDGSDLSDSDFNNCDLSYASFRFANLSGANLLFTKLSGTSFSGAVYTPQTLLPFSYLEAQKRGMILSYPKKHRSH